MAFPSRAKYVIIGAGVHGLSTAWHLAESLQAKGKNGGIHEIVLLDKGGISTGASGIAYGVLSNN